MKGSETSTALFHRCAADGARTHSFVVRLFLAVCLASLSALTACTPQSVGDSPGKELPPVVEDGGRGPNDIAFLTHHFGLVGPSERLSHQFLVRNDTDFDWAFEEVLSDCSCTVVDLPASGIAATKSAVLSLKYVSPARSADDVRTVLVRLAGGEKVLKFRIWAVVRDHLTVSPNIIEINDRGMGDNLPLALDVHSYYGKPLNLKIDQQDAECLKFSVVPLEVRKGRFEPRQRWRVSARLNPEKLPKISVRSEILVAADDDHVRTVRVPVIIDVVPPLQAVPSSLFLGQLSRNVSMEKTVLLQFSTDRRLSDGLGKVVGDTHAESVTLHHNLPATIDFSLREVQPRQWQLLLKIVPTGTEGLLSGKIDLRFSGPPHSNLSIPVVGKVTR